ncbi:hypothetical protein CLF_113189 [Clonorchis sinensis]|uniref:Uncharacterized protein n=1 Tax=Clonorchis sinensis TaxID=79923 RepID=G7YXV0_CLOSI|nr:hypothetical protein CLF_113189 [Clonorchis sinensis]
MKAQMDECKQDCTNGRHPNPINWSTLINPLDVSACIMEDVKKLSESVGHLEFNESWRSVCALMDVSKATDNPNATDVDQPPLIPMSLAILEDGLHQQHLNSCTWKVMKTSSKMTHIRRPLKLKDTRNPVWCLMVSLTEGFRGSFKRIKWDNLRTFPAFSHLPSLQSFECTNLLGQTTLVAPKIGTAKEQFVVNTHLQPALSVMHDSHLKSKVTTQDTRNPVWCLMVSLTEGFRGSFKRIKWDNLRTFPAFSHLPSLQSFECTNLLGQTTLVAPKIGTAKEQFVVNTHLQPALSVMHDSHLKSKVTTQVQTYLRGYSPHQQP